MGYGFEGRKKDEAEKTKQNKTKQNKEKKSAGERGEKKEVKEKMSMIDAFKREQNRRKVLRWAKVNMGALRDRLRRGPPRVAPAPGGRLPRRPPAKLALPY